MPDGSREIYGYFYTIYSLSGPETNAVHSIGFWSWYYGDARSDTQLKKTKVPGGRDALEMRLFVGESICCGNERKTKQRPKKKKRRRNKRVIKVDQIFFALHFFFPHAVRRA